MNIAFHSVANDAWMAGTTTQDMLFRALRSLGHLSPTILLTLWDNQPEEAAAAWRRLAHDVVHLPSKPDPGWSITAFLRQRHVDLFFSLPNETALRVELPRLLWIYDFQHVRFPEHFAPEDVERRNRLFLENARTASRILVKSRAILRDFEAFAPALSDKVRVVPFVPHIPEEAFLIDPREIAARYRLPTKFCFLPNQFLPHKNHAVVLDALSILRQRGVDAVVACTGHHAGERATACFNELLAQRDRLGLAAQFLVLDPIPRAEFFGLMRQSVCVLNPSRFEGFGLSVAEARWIGKRVIVSDLPVLQEHEHPGAMYFDPDSADDLADRLARVWTECDAGPDVEAEANVRQTHPHAQLRFAHHFLRVAEEAVAG